MASEVSDKDLQSLEDQVNKLRDRVAAEESKREAAEASAVNTIRQQELLAEKARLEAQLATAQAANKKSAIKEGVDAPLGQAVEDREHAEAARDAVQGNN